jgi:hypothetical protein
VQLDRQLQSSLIEIGGFSGWLATDSLFQVLNGNLSSLV